MQKNDSPIMARTIHGKALNFFGLYTKRVASDINATKRGK